LVPLKAIGVPEADQYQSGFDKRLCDSVLVDSGNCRMSSGYRTHTAAFRTFQLTVLLFYPSKVTTPLFPSTVMFCPPWMRCVATPVPSTAGTPYSRATMEL
jgi:hypothetical protein